MYYEKVPLSYDLTTFYILGQKSFKFLGGFLENLKGDTGKQALKHICQRFFNFQPNLLKFSGNASLFKAV